VRLALDRRLVVFDFETTGVNPRTDRVVQAAWKIYYPDGHTTTAKFLFYPGVPIPAAATEKHGITDAMVADQPTFKQRLQTGDLEPLVADDVDYGGFNIRNFDVPMLAAECARAGFGLDFSKTRCIDGARLWQILEPRTLTDAARHFCRQDISESAHDALVDVEATSDVIAEQIHRLREKAALNCVTEDLPVTFIHTVQMIHDLCFPRNPEWVDADGKFMWVNGRVTWTFGKLAGQPLWGTDQGMLRWVLKSEFSEQVKNLCTRALLGEPEPKR